MPMRNEATRETAEAEAVVRGPSAVEAGEIVAGYRVRTVLSARDGVSVCVGEPLVGGDGSRVLKVFRASPERADAGRTGAGQTGAGQAAAGRAGAGQTGSGRAGAGRRARRRRSETSEDAGVETGRERFVREAEMLASVDHEHVVRMVDLSGGVGRCDVIVLEHLERESIETLLASRSSLDAGETVTILVSLLRAIAALHAAGIAHGRIHERRIVLDRAGRPVLVGLGRARRLSDGSADDADFSRDHDRFADLAGRLIESTEIGGREHEWEGLLEWMRSASPQDLGSGYSARLEELLFDIAQPSPIRRSRPGERDGVPRQRASGEWVRRRRRGGDGDRSPRRPRLALIPELEGVAEVLDAAPVRTLRRHLSGLARSRGRPLAFGGLIALAFLVVLLTVLPGDPPEENGSAKEAAVGVPQRMRETAPSSPRATATPTASTEGAADAARTDPGADPVDAAPALLAARRDCLARSERSSCLSSVDQEGSPLWENDSRAEPPVASRSAEPETAPGSSGSRVVRRCADGLTGLCSPSIVDRAGDSALVALSPGAGSGSKDGTAPYARPASVLMIRTEAGWRLREIYED